MKSILILLLIFISCTPEKKPLTIVGKTMGTFYMVKYYGDEQKQEKVKAKINKTLLEVNRKFSTYIKDSEIEKFNNSEEGIEVSSDFIYLYELSKDVYTKSEKRFDPTVGPVVNLWGFGPSKVAVRPSDELIKDTLKMVGFHKLKLKKSILTKQNKLLRLDFSANAKGLGVDQIVNLMKDLGFSDVLVEIGGEVRALGAKQDGSPWRVGIETPTLEQGNVQKAVKLLNNAIATSGSYRNFKKYEGKVYNHTIDPQTGYPVESPLISVSVIAKNCALADSWATALMSLGSEKGPEIAQKLGLIAFFIFQANGELKTLESSKFKSYIK